MSKFQSVQFRSAYDGLADQISKDTGLLCPEPTLTQQQFAEQSDINTIVNQFLKTGELPQNMESFPRYGDFSAATDYHTSLNLVIQAQEAFESLPAKIRARFENDPAQLLEFLENEDNRTEAVNLGLVDPESLPQAAPNHASEAAGVEGVTTPPGGTKGGE